MFEYRRFKKSLNFAKNGLKFVYKNEKNFRIHIFIALVVYVLSFLLGLSFFELGLVSLVIFLILGAEIFNTIIELFIDLLKPRIHNYVETIKDLSSAAVLVLSIGAIVVAYFVYTPHIIYLLSNFFL